jgi:hypothetical protein
MALLSMRAKFISSILTLTLVTFGVAPCAAMDMGGGMAAMAGHACCEGESCPAALDEAPTAPAAPECCAVSAPANPQIPSQRVVASSAASIAPLDMPVRSIRTVVDTNVTPTAEGPPFRPCVPRHLLLSVLLI